MSQISWIVTMIHKIKFHQNLYAKPCSMNKLAHFIKFCIHKYIAGTISQNFISIKYKFYTVSVKLQCLCMVTTCSLGLHGERI